MNAIPAVRDFSPRPRGEKISVCRAPNRARGSPYNGGNWHSYMGMIPNHFCWKVNCLYLYLSLWCILSSLSPYVLSCLSFLKPPTGIVPFTEKGKESILIAAYRRIWQTLWPMAWQLAQNLPCHNVIAEIWQHYLCIERHYAFLFLIKNIISTFIVIYSRQYIHIIAV